MLACDGYQLNNRTCNAIPDTTFAILWGKSDTVVNKLIDRRSAMYIIKAQSEKGYRSSIILVEYQDAEILCRSSGEDLINRQHQLNTIELTAPVGSIGSIIKDSVPTLYFRSITDAISYVLNIHIEPLCL